MTLEIITSDTLSPVRHGFFTRRGGASSGIFAGLNCGLGSSDQRQAVQINRDRVAQAMQVTPDRVARMHQVHSATVAIVENSDDISAAAPKADALVTKTSGIALSVLTADCQPVLFADPQSGIIAAAHAGWRGTLDGVLEATVDTMIELGAQRAAIRAVIGPSISQKAYEVGPEFHENFVSENPDNTKYFTKGKAAGKFLFDLPSLGVSRLNAMGLAAVQWTGHCTYSDAERFYSYRRTTHAGEADYGRLISCITL